MSEYDNLEEITDDEPQSSEASGAAPAQPDYTAPIYRRLFDGMPAPFFNPNSDKGYYRFLFGGILMLIGCFMPFDADFAHVGYKSLSGAFCLLVALGVVWRAWISINIPTMVKMNWYALATIPFIWALVHLIFLPGDLSWSEVGTALGNINKGGLRDLGDFFQRVGPGKIFIFAGAFMIEMTFIGGVFGGAKHLKAEKKNRRH